MDDKEKNKKFRIHLADVQRLVVADDIIFREIPLESQDGVYRGIRYDIYPTASFLCNCGKKGCKGVGIDCGINYLCMN